MRGKIAGAGPNTRYYLEDRLVTRDEFFAALRPAFPDEGTGSSLVGWKPLASEGLAVHPEQVAEATADARKKGVPTEFLPDGRPVFTSRSHRKEYLKRYNCHDRDGGYGD